MCFFVSLYKLYCGYKVMPHFFIFCLKNDKLVKRFINLLAFIDNKLGSHDRLYSSAKLELS